MRELLMGLSFLSSVVPIASAAVKIDLQKIAKIESSGNPNAYNAKEQAVGLYQLRPCVLKEYNSRHKVQYTLHDLYTPAKAAVVADWYLHVRIPEMLRYYRHPVTVETVLQAYNQGIGHVGKAVSPITQRYIAKYKGEIKI
jgi:soluble lytic murein transglycosylase-like protein